MKIIIGKNAGFCFGVQRAIDKALSVNGEVYTLGEIIHNKQVVNELKDKGIAVLNDITEYKSGTIIIRSHGVGKDIIAFLQKNNIPYVDATCPFVSKIHKIVEENHNKGVKIIIIGEKNHPEVIGTNGWCNYEAIIVESEEVFSIDNNHSYCVVCQTTFSQEKCNLIIKKLKNMLYSLAYNDTICYTTKERQSETISLAQNCDIMLIIGSVNSSNTKKLFDLSKQFCKKSYLIDNIADLNSVELYKNFKIGIMAGASTPKKSIMEVINTMSETQDNVTTVTENEVEKVEEEVVVVVNNDQVADSADFEKMLKAEEKKSTVIKSGKRVKCKVYKADEKGIFVTITGGGKKDGFIDKTNVETIEEDYNPSNYKENDEIEAIIIENTSKDSSYISLSKKIVDEKNKEKKKIEEMINTKEFDITITSAVKGGLVSVVGQYTIFLPASQIKTSYVNDLEKYVGKILKVRVIESKDEPKEGKKNNKRIVVSQRIILEEKKKAKDDIFWNAMLPGTIVNGKVKRFTEFGAFVNVNGKDCLAHISDLSWSRIEKAEEILEINAGYDFVILNANRDNQRVSLGYKQLQKKPYDIAVEKFPVGTIVTGRVERLFNYGIFVSIDKGVDGLVPVSEISYEFIRDVSKCYEIGAEVQAQVVRFEGNKITLSIKALLEKPTYFENNREEVVITQEEFKEAKEKRNQQKKQKFEYKENSQSSSKKPRSSRKAEEEVSTAWSTDSENSTATFADLFKGLSFDVTDNDKN